MFFRYIFFYIKNIFNSRVKRPGIKLKCLQIAVLLIGSAFVSKAQDAYFSQFFMNPTYMNSAYTGSMKVPRVSVQYRNQWPGMGNAYIDYFAAFDAYLPRIKGGAGFLVYNDVQGDGVYSETTFKAMFSKEIILSRDWTMYGSISAGGKLNSLNFNRLTFASDIYGLSAENPPDNANRFIPDFGTGLLFFNDKYFFGVAVDHLSQPDQSLYSDGWSPLKRKYTVHFEWSYPWFHSGHLRKLLKITPNVVIQSQGSQHNITYGFYANHRGITAGVWNRITTQKNTDLILMAGYVGKQMKTAVSYDFNVNGVGLYSHGAVEISVSYLLKYPGRKSIFPYYEIPGEWDIR
jgi:type IX secretion system PorP/SprF family membrane protein